MTEGEVEIEMGMDTLLFKAEKIHTQGSEDGSECKIT